eukprot:9490047-Alexandrium_andersonii.AAC.1
MRRAKCGAARCTQIPMRCAAPHEACGKRGLQLRGRSRGLRDRPGQALVGRQKLGLRSHYLEVH